MMERIRAACIKYRTYQDPNTTSYIEGPLHSTCLDLLTSKGLDPSKRIPEFEHHGFITTKDRFIDRHEAYKLAKAKCQLRYEVITEALYDMNVSY